MGVEEKERDKEKDKDRALTMSGINRFLSRREKRTSPRLMSTDVYSLFNADERKKADKVEAKKVKALSRRLGQLGLAGLEDSHIKPTLKTKEQSEGPDRERDLLTIYEDSLDGTLYPFDPTCHLLGAVNRQSVTCYLDTILFAMFARVPTFEAILYKTFEDQSRQKLATLLRLWVNLLRRGLLITAAITEQIQQALSDCGWKEAANLRQQDASEAFTFIAETLDLPHLTLKMDIFHTGKEDDKDDHRLVNERLLEVAIPEDPEDGKVITLENCLENYFNNSIEVSRMQERRSTISKASSKPLHIDTRVVSPLSPTTTSPRPQSPIVWSPSGARDRSQSLLRRFPGSENELPEASSASGLSNVRQAHQRSISVGKKEVMMPAWQFFSLIPWYSSGEPTSNDQVVSHFAKKRPMLGLCLKRYKMSPTGQATRLNTYIDIPLDIGLPHFIQDEDSEDSGRLFGNFKLVLQSVVCHRGVSVDSGHYVTLVRGPRITDTASEGPVEVTGTIPSYQEAESNIWLLFDDLAGERVKKVDVRQALREESPYLLFYQVQPIEGHHLTQDGFEEAPPAYSERPSTQEATHTPSFAESRSDVEEGIRQEAAPKSNSDSMTTEEAPLRSSVSSDRRRSILFTDGTGQDCPLPETLRSRPGSPTQNSLDRRRSGEASRVSSKRSSRVDVKGEGSKSRQSSQLSEGRLSTTISRITDRMGRGNGYGKEAAPNITIDASEAVDDPIGTEETKKKERRAKSRNRTIFSHSDSTTEKEKEKDRDKENRECAIM